VPHAALEIVAVASIGAVAYSYAIYPFLLAAIAVLKQMLADARYVLGKKDRRGDSESELPEVAVVISAYNEEKHVAARIDNLLAQDYPSGRLHVYIGSDGSSDRTGEILARIVDPRVRAFVFAENRGKASVLNDLVERTREPVLVFSDANTAFDRAATRRLARHFADAHVGGVSGELRLIDAAGGDNQDGLYWRIEQFMKFFEGRLGALLGANGAIYAIRRELWKPLRPDTICDDFCVGMNVPAQGRRLVYEPNAWAEEESPAAIADEFNRRVRIGIGNFQALMRQPDYFTKTSFATVFAYVSHKVLRWIAPHLLIVGLAASLLLAPGSAAWTAFALLQIAGYAASAWAYRMSTRGRKLPGPLRILAFLFALNLAFLIASARYARGNYRGSWRRSER
jgi:cellulose synthase/poly-beta-1,6-N-acetylglucosamine synthase-like glycosyltransferase